VTYGADRLHEEVAYLASLFHWSLDALLDLEHADRRRYLTLAQRFALSTESRRR
jgi:hypothetical protein